MTSQSNMQQATTGKTCTKHLCRLPRCEMWQYNEAHPHSYRQLLLTSYQVHFLLGKRPYLIVTATVRIEPLLVPVLSSWGPRLPSVQDGSTTVAYQKETLHILHPDSIAWAFSVHMYLHWLAHRNGHQSKGQHFDQSMQGITLSTMPSVPDAE